MGKTGKHELDSSTGFLPTKGQRAKRWVEIKEKGVITMPFTLTLQVSVGWSTVLAFLVSGLLVGTFWYREHQRYKKNLDWIEQAVSKLVFDRRRNALVENIVVRIEKGNKQAMRDWEIVNEVVKAIFNLCWSPDNLVRAWLRYHTRVLNSQIARLKEARARHVA